VISPLVRFAVKRSLNDTKHVTVVKRRHARGPVAAVYRQVERDFGMLAPPTALHSPSPDLLAASWAILRETLLVDGAADRASREAVATGVSEANSCPYCEDVHGMTLAAIEDAGDGSVVLAWARGTATEADAELPPGTPEQAPELVGVAVAFHYYNRVVNVFLRDSPFPAHVPMNARPKARKVLGGVLRPKAAGPQAGESLDLLQPAPVPADLDWAEGNPVIADAFARAYEVAETAGARSVPAGVRELVRDRLSTWDGAAPGLSRAWVEDAVSTLPEEDRPAGRLALLVAYASYQIDDDVVAAFRRTQPADSALVDLVAWAGMAAARRISQWQPRQGSEVSRAA
jgi:AhpD family alkylhydroperoxidase